MQALEVVEVRAAIREPLEALELIHGPTWTIADQGNRRCLTHPFTSCKDAVQLGLIVCRCLVRYLAIP